MKSLPVGLIACLLLLSSSAQAQKRRVELDEHPWLYGYGGVGLGYGMGLHLTGRLNSNPWGPLLFSVKGRAGSLTTTEGGRYGFRGFGLVDGLVGFSFTGGRKSGSDSERTGIVDQTATTTTYQVRRVSVQERTHLALVGGARKLFFGGSGSAKPPLHGVIGLHWLNFNAFGNMKVAELNVFVAESSGLPNETIGDRLGGSLSYLNSIPSIPGLIFGLEVGLSSVFYATLDVGWAFGS